MSCPSCNIVVNVKDLGLTGIISCSVSVNTDVVYTANGIYLKGPTTGTLSLSAYPYLTSDYGLTIRRPARASDRLLGVGCVSRAQASCEWIQKVDCETDRIYFIPKWGGKAFLEGDVTLQGDFAVMGDYVRLEKCVAHYDTFNADASSGPTTPILRAVHADGFNLIYTGLPISLESGRPKAYKGILDSIFPESLTTFYLTSFDLSINPPFESRVGYNFVFRYTPL